jgi:arylsulfatase A-like enzyme
MLTGRWPHELSAGWLTPLDDTSPTIAEFLASHGYATAGFTANHSYCGWDSGLGRGFTRFEDYIFPELTALHIAVAIDGLVDGFQAAERFVEEWLDLEFLRPASHLIWKLFKQDRKSAGAVNGEFLDWLSRRPQNKRPFFAFLNFFDAHQPYELPDSGIHRFGLRPRNDREIANIQDWIPLLRQGATAAQIAFARDAYEDCIAELDEQLGMLIDELDRRAILGHTWLIIAADHGENFGEHAGVFLHGATLYQTERHVPLVIIPPSDAPSQQVVSDPVSLRDITPLAGASGWFVKQQVVSEAASLRDIPATVVDLVGMKSWSPFPGSSLARFWNGSPSDGPAGSSPSSGVISEVVPIDPLDPNPPTDRDRRWPVAALTERDWTYIRREGDVREELFHLNEDPGESHNRAGDPALQPTLERMRKALGQMTAGPLTPERFRP